MADIEKDLPDPLEDTAPDAASDPDDLIAQMAGDAIDKLIEDSENGLVPDRSASQPDPAEQGVAEMSESQSADASQVPTDAASVELHTDSELTDVLDPVADAPAVASPQSELDTIFNSLNNEDAVDASAVDSDSVPDTGRDTGPDTGPDADTTNTLDDNADLPAEIARDDAHGESSAMIATDMSEDAELALRADVNALLNDAVEQEPVSRTPWIVVAILRLVNAPFASVPDEARDILGQIAIITLVNALAVILYVIIFR